MSDSEIIKTFTFFIAIIHLVYIIGVMWLGPLFIYLFTRGFTPCSKTKIMGAYMAVIIAQILHWRTKSMNNECILSLWEKRSQDSNYVTGSEPEKTFAWILILKIFPSMKIEDLRCFHIAISKLSFLFAILFMLTAGTNCFWKNTKSG
jgi:hypothetical protein